MRHRKPMSGFSLAAPCASAGPWTRWDVSGQLCSCSSKGDWCTRPLAACGKTSVSSRCDRCASYGPCAKAFKGDLDCAPVKRLLRGLLDTFPDNKIVEDVHNFVKLDAQKTRKGGRCAARQADAVVHSGVLESREISHPAKVALKSCLGYVRLAGSFWVVLGLNPKREP